MEKAILIEDRKGRQARFLSSIEINALNDIRGFSMPKNEACREWIDKINSGATEELQDFSLIMIHRSVVGADGLRALSRHCKKQKTNLILFSGGLGQVIYDNSSYQLLSLNSSDFYCPKLVEFIKSFVQGEVQNLLELIYGPKWELELLLRYRFLKARLESETNIEVKIRLRAELEELRSATGIDPDNINVEVKRKILIL